MSRTLLTFSGVSKRFCRRPELRGRRAAVDIARELCGLSPCDRLRSGEFWSLRDIDLELVAGEVLGVIGHNGAGKSTLMNLAGGNLLPTTGTISSYADSICKLDPYGLMSPLETGRENIILQLVYHGVPSAEIDDEVAAIASVADLTDRLDETVGTYSTGMRGRLGFAIFSRLRPDVFLVDESIGAGDRRFRDQFRGFLEQYVADGGAMLLCVHDSQTIQSLCHRVLVLDHGRCVLTADPATALDAYNAIAVEHGALPMPVFRSHAGRSLQAGGDAQPSSGVEAEDHSRDLSITELLIGGVDGHDPTPGSAAEITIRCRAGRPIDRVECVVEIGRGEWFPLAAIHGPPAMILPAGTDLSCRVASLPLAPGRYDVHVRLSDADSGLVLADTHSRAPRCLRVVSSGPTPTAAPGRGPIVHMVASWTAASAAAELGGQRPGPSTTAADAAAAAPAGGVATPASRSIAQGSPPS